MPAIAVAFATLAMGYALVTPPWNNPDEPAHFNYVRHVATTGSLPELQPGDWDAARLEDLKARQFPPGEPIEGLEYESHQPPLYYVLAAPIYLVTSAIGGQEASLMALRFVSIALGVLVVLISFRVAQLAIAPASELASKLFPLLVAGIVAFIPMHTAMSAAVNNDALAYLLSALLLLSLVRGLVDGLDTRATVLFGALCGALLITKLTTYGLVAFGLAAFALISLRAAGGVGSASARSIAAYRLGLALLVIAAVAGWWFIRQGMVYGWDDLLAIGRHEMVVVGQPRWADLDVDPFSHFTTTLFQSFWAQFGWMGVLVDERLYRLFGLFGVLALLGISLRLQRRAVIPFRPAPEIGPLSPGFTPAVVFLALAAVVVLAGVVYYNLTFVQPQGRYLFPALVAIAALAAIGWGGLVGQGRAATAFAAGWIVAALVEGGGLLMGAELSVTIVYGAALALGALVASATRQGQKRPFLRQVLLVGPIPALALLNLVALTRYVAPAFAA